MSLWDDLPSDLTGTGALDALEPVLDAVDTPTSTTDTDADGTWTVYRTTVGGDSPLSLDPATGGFTRGAGTGSTPIEFPDPRVGLELRLHQDSGGSADGWVRLIVAAPKAIVRLPFLTGARLDAQGQLRADPANPDVKFHLPALRFQIDKPAGGAVSFTVLSASTGATPVDEIYEFVRMEPPHALIGPSDAVGFAFRTAVLDLSGTSGPSGVPANAVAMPSDWQGFYLPEARLFVSPSGMEGLAVSGGVRNMWIGIGEHAGVTGIFEAEIVNRGSDPEVRLRFQTPTGEWIGAPDTDSATPIELPEQTRLYVDAGGGIAPITISITVGSTTTSGDRADVTTPSTGNVSISVTATDAGSHTTTRSITVARRGATGGGGVSPSGSADVQLQSTSTGSSTIELVGWTTTNATLRVSPGGGTINWTWPGGSHTGDTAVVPVAASATVQVTATRPLLTQIDCFMLFDRPPNRRADIVEAYVDNPTNTRTEPANSRTAFTDGDQFQSASSLARFAQYPAGTTWTVDGYASYEGDDSTTQQNRNRRLSERRRDALIRLMKERAGIADSAITTGTAHGHAVARTSSSPAPGSGRWWRATATASLTVPADETITATLTRPTTPVPPPDVDPPPTSPPRPDCFRKLGFRVELIRGTFVRAEIYGEFDIHTAAEQRLSANSAGSLPARTNPNDGIAQFLLRLRIAEDRSSWDVTAEFRAIEGDLDGLAKAEAPSTGASTGLNVLGAIAALSPLLAAATPPSPRNAEIVPMIVASGVAIGLGASGVMTTKHVILRGGELMVSDGLVDPASGTGPHTTQVSILVDVETAFTFDLGFIRTRPDKPITTRYKAVGVRSTWSEAPQPDGTIEYLPLPVFDSSKGYTLDIPDGSLVAADPLGEILRVLGVRVSRDNPTYIEVEVGLGVDLGIVTVESARVRLRLDAVETPQLTKLAASLEIPGTLHGKGSVEITNSGFSGTFDLTITPVSLRVAATLTVSTVGGITGVLVGAEVEFPVPIALGSSGLGIFGFMGGVGVNFNRLEPTGVTTPALKWVEAQFRRGSVMDGAGWQHSPGGFAFAAGMLVGTLEGGFVAHLKGIVLIELPGPRLLLIMKADVLKLPPVLDSDQSATFLAVLDIDFGRGEITIGIVAEYSIKELLHIRIPVTAFFSTEQPQNWFVDLGTFKEPATVKVLDVIEGAGYVMVHGNGITDFPVPVVTTGLTIGLGFHIRAVLMGSKSIGLYLEVAAGFDAVVSIKPFALGGIIYARGELRLFIISIGASAELTVLVGRQLVGSTEVDRTYIHGEVCGKVSFFFFSIKACLELTIGDEFTDPPPAPDLIAGVVLISRAPALIEGSAGDRLVDGKLGDAVPSGDGDELPTVPLDAIPAILFNHPTDEASGNIVLGGTAGGASGLPADPWIRTGEWWFRYRITSVTLTGPLLPSTGETPATWWARGLPGDSTQGPALALLNWTPDPTPQAVVYGEKLTTTTIDRWGRICDEPAPPAPMLWTFDGEPLGPSDVGWVIDGVAWPDSTGTYRSSDVDARLEVSELWRTGDERLDELQATDPAVVIGDAVPCDRDDPDEITDIKQWGVGHPPDFSEGAVPYDDGSFPGYGELAADGVALSDMVAARASTAWVPSDDAASYNCSGRILQSPDNDLDRPNTSHEVTDQELAEGWDKLGFVPSDLENAVRLHHGGGLDELTLLLMAPRSERQDDALLLRYLDVDGNTLGEEVVGHQHLVSGGNPIPSEWTDPTGPWADPLHRSGMVAARVAATAHQVLFLVPCEVPSDTVTVDVGWKRDALRGEEAPLFYVVAAAALTATERSRHDWDTTTITREREIIETTLAQDPDDRALLSPGTVYTVNVTWESKAVEKATRPNAADDSAAAWTPSGGTTQSFRFGTHGTTEAPKDLNGWLLATTPGPDEVGLLCQEPVLIVFATQNVARLFDAYDEELRIVVRSASGEHPTPPGGSGPGAPLPIPVGTGGIVQPLITDDPVMRPWEQAIRELVDDLPCIDTPGIRVHHDVVTITYDFEPLTDYLLDVVAVTKGAPESAPGRRVHRIGFTTSRFDTVDEIAELVLDAPIRHDYVADVTKIAALSSRPTGAEVDAAFLAAGLDAPSTPRYPEVTVLWNGATVPQPVAVVLDSSEPLWRERPMPKQVTDVASTETPKPKWWVAANTPWLEPQNSTTAPAAGDPPRTTITRIIRAPGDSRAVVVLGANSRDTELMLDLVVPSNVLYADPERRTRLFGLRFVAAPWEEES